MSGTCSEEDRPPAQHSPDFSALQDIPLDRIDVPARPARRFLGDIDSLAASMDDYGLQQPISVRTDGPRFILTSGMRRLAAARALGWNTIPAWVRSVTADDAYLLDLIENLQRQDLSPEEEADALGELIRTRGWTLQQVAASVKRSLAYVSKRVRVFEDPHLRAAIAEGGLPVSTAEELLAADPARRRGFIQQALAQHWDQVQARDALRPPREAGTERRPAQARRPPLSLAERRQAGQADGLDFVREDFDLAAVRPRGFTRAVRDFHRIVIGVRSQDLTPADRGALRALFRDLVLLARSPSQRGAHVFPPLPSTGQTPSGRSRRRRKLDASQRGRPHASARP